MPKADDLLREQGRRGEHCSGHQCQRHRVEAAVPMVPDRARRETPPRAPTHRDDQVDRHGADRGDLQSCRSCLHRYTFELNKTRRRSTLCASFPRVDRAASSASCSTPTTSMIRGSAPRCAPTSSRLPALSRRLTFASCAGRAHVAVRFLRAAPDLRVIIAVGWCRHPALVIGLSNPSFEIPLSDRLIYLNGLPAR